MKKLSQILMENKNKTILKSYFDKWYGNENMLHVVLHIFHSFVSFGFCPSIFSFTLHLESNAIFDWLTHLAK